VADEPAASGDADLKPGRGAGASAADAVAAVYDRRTEERHGNIGGHRPPLQQDPDSASWPDASAESAFLAEARARGESVSVAKPAEAPAEEADPKSLPPLDELVNRIPAEVREVLDDLFRARFVTVKRVPRRALKE